MKSRIRKKLLKKSLIIMDMKSIPLTMTVENWYNITKFGIIPWDSTNGGEEPKIFPNKNKSLFTIKDTTYAE